MNGSPLEKGSKLEELVTNIRQSDLLHHFNRSLMSFALQEHEKVLSPRFPPSTSEYFAWLLREFID